MRKFYITKRMIQVSTRALAVATIRHENVNLLAINEESVNNEDDIPTTHAEIIRYPANYLFEVHALTKEEAESLVEEIRQSVEL